MVVRAADILRRRAAEWGQSQTGATEIRPTNGHPANGHPNTDDFHQAPVTPISADVGAKLAAGEFAEPASRRRCSRLDAVRGAVADSIIGAAGYVRQRVTGDYEVDDFGFDQHFTESVWLPALRVLFDKWFRVEVSGIENLPMDGGGLLVANHAGTIPIDALMTSVAVHDHHPTKRHLRVLAADLVFDTPFISEIARRTGSTLACTADAQRLLRGGELTAVWPEGFKGIGKLYKDRYKLQRFGRGGFVTTALRAGVPIIPVSIVGSEEIYPMLSDLKPIARLLGLPYVPVTPTFPLLGPLGLVPLAVEVEDPFRDADRDRSLRRAGRRRSDGRLRRHRSRPGRDPADPLQDAQPSRQHLLRLTRPPIVCPFGEQNPR